MHKLRKRRAFYNKLRVPYKKEMNSIVEIAKAWKKDIRKLKDFEQIITMKLPEGMNTKLGKSLSNVIITGFYGGDITNRKPTTKKDDAKNLVPRSQFRANRIIPYNTLPDPDDLWEIDWNIEQAEALQAFDKEAFEVGEKISTQLLDDIKMQARKAITEGQSFSEFLKQVQMTGYEPANPYHLRTNYSAAVNNSYKAGDWIASQNARDLFPYLLYVAILDDRTRDEHEALHGYVMLADSIFWDTHYPINGWNCRCDTEQLTASEAQSNYKYGQEPPNIDIDKNFSKNSGKDKTIWGDWLKE
jgi:SPP1 gp7 family putative phage head morphogenesis protein